jgi:hypothetical protein
MKPESLTSTPANTSIDQEVSHAQSAQLAPGETGAEETQGLNENTPRCAFRFSNRHQCRFPVTPHSAPFCQKHFSFRPNDPNSINLAPALLGDLTELTSAVDMQMTLSKLFILLAQNRVTTKKASVLTYIIQQLLRTLPAIDREVNGEDGHVNIIMDMPRPNRD